MKLLRFGTKGSEKLGVLDTDNNIRDLSSLVDEIDNLYLADQQLLEKLRRIDFSELPLATKDVRIGSPLKSPGKLVFVGFNSQEHARELGVPVNKKNEPILFMKPVSSMSGPHDPIFYSRYLQKLDWEAELAIVIGKQGKYIAVEDAAQHIFGYTCCNDLSDRYLQFEIQDKQFTKGKCFDGSAVIGPYLVTADEIKNSSDLHIKLWVNDELRQSFNTCDYILNDAEVIAFVSKYFTLYPGDVISMGSAPGCASSWGNNYLQPNDTLTLEISSLGRQKQIILPE